MLSAQFWPVWHSQILEQPVECLIGSVAMQQPGLNEHFVTVDVVKSLTVKNYISDM